MHICMYPSLSSSEFVSGASYTIISAMSPLRYCARVPLFMLFIPSSRLAIVGAVVPIRCD